MRLENSPIVKEFTSLVIRTIYLNKYPNLSEEKEIINADLIPRISEDIIKQRLFSEREIRPIPEKPIFPKSEVNLQKLAEPISAPKPISRIMPGTPQPVKKFPEPKTIPTGAQQPMPPVQMPVSKSITKPAYPPQIQTPVQQPPTLEAILPKQASGTIGYTKQIPKGSQVPPEMFGKYGKIEPLLRDPAVTLIECSGAGKNLNIIRAGQREFTRIVLNEGEINKILENISNEARIPLIEGVFRAAVDNFVVNSVVSKLIGSRFIIKKQTPYSLIDPSQQGQMGFR